MIHWQAYIPPPRQGTSHKRGNLPCQDKAVVKESNEVIVAVLADGLGSLEHSDIAADAITLAISQYLLNYAYKQLNIDSLKAGILEECKRALFERAESQNISISKMDCTLLFVVLLKKRRTGIIGQLGDGAICVVKRNQGYQPIALDDNFKASSNLTKTVLSTDALDNFNLGVIDASDPVGFFLTTDGLENELYSKAGKVKKKVKWYFNLISNNDESVCESAIQKRWDELTLNEQYGFTDDMSLIAIVQPNIEIELPEDANWLCTCSHRNRMESSRCESCGNDFLKIYKGVNFRQVGGKLSFFEHLNDHPKKEQLILKEPSSYLQVWDQTASLRDPQLELEPNTPSQNPRPRQQLMKGGDENPEKFEEHTITVVPGQRVAPAGKTYNGNGHKQISSGILEILAYLLLAFVSGIIFHTIFTSIKDDSRTTTESLSIQRENDILQSEN